MITAIVSYFCIFLLGAAILIIGGLYLIESAAKLARKIGVSEFIIGLTIVAIGTSLPELATCIYASFTSHTDIAVGNIVGTNIANIGLILGLCAIIRPFRVKSEMLKRDGYIMLVATLVFGALVVFDQQITIFEGILLLIIFLFYLWMLFGKKVSYVKALKEIDLRDVLDEIKDFEWQAQILKLRKLRVELLLLILGIGGVVVGSKLLIDSASEIANYYRLDASIIGVTLVACTTSLPELVVGVIALLSKHNTISLGNIIGSNITNVFLILGVTAIVSPLQINLLTLTCNLPLMILFTALLLLLMWVGWSLSRMDGSILIVAYVLFLMLNFGYFNNYLSLIL